MPDKEKDEPPELDPEEQKRLAEQLCQDDLRKRVATREEKE